MRWDHAQTPYQILGLEMGATADEIAIAYKRLIVEVHPDRDSSAVALTRFKRIRDAFELLADSSRRSEYDQEFRRDHAGTTGLPSVFVYVRKKRGDREIALEDASWKHELMSASQFDLILKLQKQVNGINAVEIKWNLLFADAHRVEPSKGNAALLIDYLLDLEAIGRKYGSRWEQLESNGISDFETLDLEHPRLSGSPFYLAGYSIGDRYFRDVFDRYKAPHIAEAQRIAKLAADRDLLRAVFPTIRTACLSLPEVKEVETEFGRTFSANHKVFVREIYAEAVGIGFRATAENAKLFLAEDHFSTCRIPGSKQWICRHVRPIPDRQELECLIIGSYRLIALKRSLEALESILRPGELFGDVIKRSET